MKIKTWIKHMEPYLPTPRHRKYRYRECEDYVDIELQEATKADLTPAFKIEDGQSIFLYQDNLYAEASIRSVWGGEEGKFPDALSALKWVHENCSTYFGFDTSDTRERMIGRAQKKMSCHLLVDGKLFYRTSEPYYQIATFGCGNNHGSTALLVSRAGEGMISNEYSFSALDYDLAVQKATEVALKRGDTDSVGNFGTEKIKVLLPEAVKFPREDRPVAEETPQAGPITLGELVQAMGTMAKGTALDDLVVSKKLWLEIAELIEETDQKLADLEKRVNSLPEALKARTEGED